MYVRSIQRGEYENDIAEIPKDTANTNFSYKDDLNSIKWIIRFQTKRKK